MKLSLPANISRLRKENSKTQEQLTEALGGYLCVRLKMGTRRSNAGVNPDCGDGGFV